MTNGTSNGTPPEELGREIKIVDPIDAGEATKIAIKYLESLYGNLNLLLFRIEDVRKNGDNTRYFVLCSLLTNVGGPRRYYFIKVDIKSGSLLKISKGFRNSDTEKIEWKEENIPEDAEEE